MKRILLLLLATGVLLSCSKNEVETPCSTIATVRDYTGLDGCGWIFELQDGTRLIPVMQLICGTPPLPKEITEDPLFDFEFVDGKKVSLSYEEVYAQANICMAGLVVKITCLKELPPSNTGEH